MAARQTQHTVERRGIVLYISLLFVAIFASLGFAMLTMSSRNVKVADNHRDANRALQSALSGIDVMTYYMSKVSMPGATPPANRFSAMASDLASYVAVGEDNPVTLSSSDNTSFAAELQSLNNDSFRVMVAGSAGDMRRSVAVNYTFGVREDTVFDFGIATKGPLQLSGNILLNGTNIAVEADVYIESETDGDVLSIIGNSQIAGKVNLTQSGDPQDMVNLQGGKASIGGETGDDAFNHITTGVPPTDFPVPNTSHFEQYATGSVITAATNLHHLTTFTNVRIAPNTNPSFSAKTHVNGIMFVEAPNVVTFTGNCEITGLIVCEGDTNDDSGENRITFQGNVESRSVADLPHEEQFEGLREETGTFLMAPGFHASFGGNFDTLNGAIAANGITFFGNAGGTIAGSVINYADTPMTLSGNSDLYFNRSGITEVPAGFEPEIILHYDASSYNEIVN